MPRSAVPSPSYREAMYYSPSEQEPYATNDTTRRQIPRLVNRSTSANLAPPPPRSLNSISHSALPILAVSTSWMRASPPLYEHTAALNNTSLHLNLLWQTISTVSFHASYAEGFRAPSLTEFEELQRIRTDDINDPQLNGENYDVSILLGGNPEIVAEKSRTYQIGLTIEPKWIEELSLRALATENYYNDKLNTRGFDTIVNFEGVWHGVTPRADNRITMVDGTTINFGKIYVLSADFGLT